jgi:dephospho-CoA kinase
MKIIAFVGAPASGKTEAASMAKEMGIPVITMGDVVREELKKRDQPVNDANAGRIATELREAEGMDAIAKRCMPLVKNMEKKKVKVIVIEGIRGIAEVEAFKGEFGADFILVRIEAPLNLRYERIKSRKREDDILSMEDFKGREEREKEWGMGEAMEKAAIVVNNEDSLPDWGEKIRVIFKQTGFDYGHRKNKKGFSHFE